MVHDALEHEKEHLGILLNHQKIEKYLIGFSYPFGYLINKHLNFADKSESVALYLLSKLFVYSMADGRIRKKVNGNQIRRMFRCE